jgi:hypothetical protein
MRRPRSRPYLKPTRALPASSPRLVQRTPATRSLPESGSRTRRRVRGRSPRLRGGRLRRPGLPLSRRRSRRARPGIRYAGRLRDGAARAPARPRDRHARPPSGAELDPPVRAALRIGAYQLGYLESVPPHAAANESVELVRAPASSALSRSRTPSCGGSARASGRSSRVWEKTRQLRGPEALLSRLGRRDVVAGVGRRRRPRPHARAERAPGARAPRAERRAQGALAAKPRLAAGRGRCRGAARRARAGPLRRPRREGDAARRGRSEGRRRREASWASPRAGENAAAPRSRADSRERRRARASREPDRLSTAYSWMRRARGSASSTRAGPCAGEPVRCRSSNSTSCASRPTARAGRLDHVLGLHAQP